MNIRVDRGTLHRTSSRARHRRASAAVWGLISLVLVTAIAGTLGRLALSAHRVVLRDQKRVQCDWLVASGLSLARARLTSDAKYMGETWNISPAQFNGTDTAEVQIRVKPEESPNPLKGYEIQISARYPAGSVTPIQLTRTFLLK